MEPLIAGDRPETIDNPTDASDPCRPGTTGLADYKGPLGCYIHRLDPNCFNPNQISVGLLYATTEECRPNTADPRQIPNPGPGDFCRSTPGAVDLNGKNAEPVLEGDGVKSRAGVADLFITDSSGRPEPAPNFLHLSAINSFAEVTCRPAGPNDPRGAAGTLVPTWEVRSQVVYVNGQLGPLGIALDIIPGLIPNASPTVLNRYGELGPIRFNATYINNNEPGGAVGPDEGQPRRPNPTTGDLNLNGDADPSTPAFEPVTKVVQRAVDVAGAVVAGEAVVDVTRAPCAPGVPPNAGKIVIKKVTDPANDNTAFGFTSNGAPFGPLAGGQQAEFNNVAPGPYVVTENENTAYEQSVTCTETGGTNANPTTTAGRTATIRLDNNETVTCTFVNKRKPVCTTPPCDPCPPGTKPKDGKCVPVCPKGHERGDHCRKPPKCDRNGDGREDHDRDRDGRDDRDRNGDGRDDRNGKNLRRTDRNGDGKDDECERDRKERKKCSDRQKRSKKADKGKDRDDDKGDRRSKGDRDDDRGQCRNKKSKKSKKSKK